MDERSRQMMAAILQAQMPTAQQMIPQPTNDPRLNWNRAQANTAEAFGMNSIQRATGLNFDPNVGIASMYQPQLPPERRIQETFRMMPGYY